MEPEGPDYKFTTYAKRNGPRPNGCLYVTTVGAGFIGFIVLGILVSELSQEFLAVPYLIGSGAGAIWMVTKPRLRGLGIGTLLGLGSFLLLLSICGNLKLG
jgi:hypothetical protein